MSPTMSLRDTFVPLLVPRVPIAYSVQKKCLLLVSMKAFDNISVDVNHPLKSMDEITISMMFT